MAIETSPLVLIVDDDPDGREMYATTMKMAGFRVEQAADGFEAVDKAYKLHPGVILMDLLMPRLDGWEVVGWLQRNATTRSIPIVAVTGASEEQRLKAKAEGCERVLVKPCLPDQLLAEVRSVLAGQP
jgi:CheY-like chemotaxis protein